MLDKNRIFIEELSSLDNILIIQDVDGVCIPLVKDPLDRRISFEYMHAVAKLGNEFRILTNGEHEGYRGLNRIVETACKDKDLAREEGLYLPGLAAGGVEWQDNYGNALPKGVGEKELTFLSRLPLEMQNVLIKNLSFLTNDFEESFLEKKIKESILDTKYSPTINLNKIFELIPDNLNLKVKVQEAVNIAMNSLIVLAEKEGLGDSFYLHIAPNLGTKDGIERLKPATKEDIGTTDIQFMVKGAIKEIGLLVILNEYVKSKTGNYPLGEDFNARSAPRKRNQLMKLCQDNFTKESMPTIIGVGDTVTSEPNFQEGGYLRGGSDRGFLMLIQEIGEIFNKTNKVFLVDSSFGEVVRPTLSSIDLKGISDKEDPLRFNALFKKGPKQYIEWFIEFAQSRSTRRIVN